MSKKSYSSILILLILLVVSVALGLFSWVQGRGIAKDHALAVQQLEAMASHRAEIAGELEALQGSLAGFTDTGRIRFEGTDAEVLAQMADAMGSCFEAELAEIRRLENIERQKAEEAARPKPNTLNLESRSVVQDQQGYVASLVFDPARQESIGVVAVVIRLPKDSASSIVDFGPKGDVKLSGVSSRIGDDGKFMVYQGTLEQPQRIEFELRVTEPVTADVRGNAGIGEFKLDIGL